MTRKNIRRNLDVRAAAKSAGAFSAIEEIKREHESEPRTED